MNPLATLIISLSLLTLAIFVKPISNWLSRK